MAQAQSPNLPNQPRNANRRNGGRIALEANEQSIARRLDLDTAPIPRYDAVVQSHNEILACP